MEKKNPKRPLPGDRALLDLYRQSDPTALERIYLAYLGEVTGLLRRGFRFSSKGREMHFSGYPDGEQLRDALQETFLHAFGPSARRNYDGLQPFHNYLLAIARNVVLGHFRKDVQRLSRFKPIDAADHEMGSDSVGARQSAGIALAEGQPEAPDEGVERMRLRRFIEDFVAGLKEQQRQVLKLHFMEHQSQDATAQALGVDRNRVRKQIRAIRKKLWKSLQREGLDRALPFQPKAQEAKP